MKELTDEDKRILAELKKAQAAKDTIPDSQKIPISNPDKYDFSIGIPDELILCPYCLDIIDESTSICPHCKGDTTADAPIEMTLAEYNNAERVKCSFCNKSKLRLAKICSSCGK